MDKEIHVDLSPLGKFKGKSTPYYELWPGAEAIDIMAAALTPEEFKGYLKGNILKYKLRAGDKPCQSIEKDLGKARHYKSLLKALEESHGV